MMAVKEAVLISLPWSVNAYFVLNQVTPNNVVNTLVSYDSKEVKYNSSSLFLVLSIICTKTFSTSVLFN